ncbi:hypothetical protein LRAMOSA01758 [Lichtheimia ramosa]|uniref:Heterokaryon incompatibility domain-containing protein n=1 Tax=Lichtheimia ramosa TaxID=688394 RepID=A0A077WKZ6_9FUNG|nr:hypothetical protein LRAMOSA01758 [Lichtheimia ramosa]
MSDSNNRSNKSNASSPKADDRPTPENANIAMEEETLDSEKMLAQFLSPDGPQNHLKLYQNDNFKLVRVEYENDQLSMTSVVPAENTSILDDLMSKGYNVVSHLWGPPDELVDWEDSGVLDEQGNPIRAAKIRDGKQTTILNLFKDYPGYWWIDLFCADTEHTPRGIMGYIYKFANLCFALLDCANDSIKYLATHEQTLQKWSDKLHPGVIDDNALKAYYDRTSAIEGMDWKRTMRFIFDQDDAFADALSDVMDCKFFQRVGTLQEAVLPRKVLLMAEMGWDGSTTLDIKSLRGITGSMCTTVRKADRDIDSETISQHLKRIKTMADEIDLIWNLKEYGQQQLEDCQLLKKILVDFRRSGRRCTHPRDYVHGVIGMLQIHIPMSDDCMVIWEGFRDELRKKQVYVNKQFDFSEATHMGWVYSRIHFHDHA